MDRKRVKIVRLDERLIVDVLNWCRDPKGYLMLPDVEGLPEDAVVVSCRDNWERRTLEVLVYHPSFEEVPEGDIPPVIEDVVKKFRIMKFDKDLAFSNGWGKSWQ